MGLFPLLRCGAVLFCAADGNAGLAPGARPGYAAAMSRTPIAAVAGLAFVVAYIAVAISIPDVTGRMHWVVEALYWTLAGIVWVFPIRWLMLWSVHKR